MVISVHQRMEVVTILVCHGVLAVLSIGDAGARGKSAFYNHQLLH
jgi:hypothetical protein